MLRRVSGRARPTYVSTGEPEPDSSVPSFAARDVGDSGALVEQPSSASMSSVVECRRARTRLRTAERSVTNVRAPHGVPHVLPVSIGLPTNSGDSRVGVVGQSAGVVLPLAPLLCHDRASKNESSSSESQTPGALPPLDDLPSQQSTSPPGELPACVSSRWSCSRRFDSPTAPASQLTGIGSAGASLAPAGRRPSRHPSFLATLPYS